MPEGVKEKIKLVEQLGKIKRKKVRDMDDDDGIDFDTYEANFVPEYEDDEEDTRA